MHKSISAAKLPYREAVKDHSPGLVGLGFRHKELALKAERADFDGAFPGLKAWAVLLNRFAVRSNRLVYKAPRVSLHFTSGLSPFTSSACFGLNAG
jgi:hypothetical protein